MVGKMADLARSLLNVVGKHERRMARDSSSSVHQFIPPFMQNLVEDLTDRIEKGSDSQQTLQELLSEKGIPATATCKPPPKPLSDDEYEGDGDGQGATSTATGAGPSTSG